MNALHGSRQMVCFVAGLLASCAAQGVTTEADFLDDLPVVLSASRLSQPLNEAPAAVTVIDEAMIRASGFRDIPDLLRLVPGFSVAYTRDNSWAVGYHGVADAFSRRFQVLVDGRSIYNPAFGSVNWTELPLVIDDIERIEVVRGPNAVTYGANAFFAVINIITKHASQTVGGYAHLLAGEQGMAGGIARYGGGNEHLHYRLTASLQNRDRFERDAVDGVLEPHYERSHTDVLSGRLDAHLSATDEVSAQFGLTSGDWNAGRYFHADEPVRQKVHAQFAQVKFRRSLSADDEWMVQAYFSRNDFDAPQLAPVCVDMALVPPALASCPGGTPSLPRYPAAPGNPVILADIDLLQTRANLEFQWNRRLARDWRAAAGAEWRYESATSQRYFGTDKKLDGALGRAFLNLEWSLRPGWLLQGGAMFEQHYLTGFDVSPRAALNVEVADHHTLRLNISQAYRSPTFFEQQGNLAYYTTTGTPVRQILLPAVETLEPERILSRELGYVGRWPQAGMQWDVKLFRDTVERAIDTSGKPSRFDNGNGFRLQGGDAQLAWQPAPDVTFNAQYARVFIDIDPGLDKDLPKSAPRNLFSLLARYDMGHGWSASAGVYRSGRMYWLGDGDVTQAYTRVDMRLARRWTWLKHDMEAAIVGQNLGEDYTEFRMQNVFSQRAYGSLRFSW